MYSQMSQRLYSKCDDEALQSAHFINKRSMAGTPRVGRHFLHLTLRIVIILDSAAPILRDVWK
ncbi:MAG: hypothetical protein WAL66_17225 [Nitrososphaeraceae archaeon]